MSENLEGRERKVDLDALSAEQAELIGEELGKRLGLITEEVVARVNKLTRIYGIEAKLAIQLIDIKTGTILRT